MRILAGSGMLFRYLRRSQARFDVPGEEFLERDTLLDGSGFDFLKKRIREIEGRSHPICMA
jgi:hypothetical protein